MTSDYLDDGDAPVVRTSTGLVRGVRLADCDRHYGIPYAADPVGPLRFAAPRPAPSWEGIRDATVPAATSQRVRFDANPAIPEPIIPGDDVLHVDVWAPHAPGPHPVLVWIHGGGWEAGSSAQPWFDGTRFTRHGIVVVSVGYRLGVDGFLPLADAPANRGLLDCVAALRWVRAEIAAFGGDPTQVTLAGQSAGAGLTLAVLASPNASGLVTRAIVESPAWMRSGSARSVTRAARAHPSDPPPTAAALATASCAELDDMQARLRGDRLPGLALRPRVDPVSLPRRPDRALAAGASADVPLLIGATTEEFRGLAFAVPVTFLPLMCVLVPLRQRMRPRRLWDVIRETWGPRFRRSRDSASTGARRGPHERGVRIREFAAALVSEGYIRGLVADVADGRARIGAPTWVYDAAWRGEIGAEHCTDIPLFWDALDAPGVAEFLRATPPQALTDRMHASWVRFIRGDDPGFARNDGPGRHREVFG